jgi:hypothetical protein
VAHRRGVLALAGKFLPPVLSVALATLQLTVHLAGPAIKIPLVLGAKIAKARRE